MKISTPANALKFSQKLRDAAEWYAALVNAGAPKWAQYDGAARDAVDAIQRLGMIQARPLALAIVESFQPDEITKGLKYLVSCGVRFLIVGGLGGGMLERHYCERAKATIERAIASAAQLRDALKDVVPTDRRFVEAFAVASVSKIQLARY